jgi:ribosome-associated protein
MKLPQLEKLVVDALEDIKGRDIEVINTSRLTALFDRIVIACGDSNRQVKSLARNVQDKAREAGGTSSPAKAKKSANGCWSTLATSSCMSCSRRVRSYYP